MACGRSYRNMEAERPEGQLWRGLRGDLPCDGDLLNVVLKFAKPGKRIVGILSVSRICKKRWVDELRDVECNERLPLLNSIGHGFHGRRDLMPHFD
jgi:hypothetical protein